MERTRATTPLATLAAALISGGLCWGLADVAWGQGPESEAPAREPPESESPEAAISEPETLAPEPPGPEPPAPDIPVEASPDADAEDSPEEAEVVPVTRTREERREVLDYDGRSDPGPTAEEILVWVPRVLFSPVHLVLEYIVRRPIGALLTAIERERLHIFLIDFFTWDHRNAGLIPTALFDFGLMPSAGVYFFWNDAGAPGHDLRAYAAIGGADYLRASLSDRVLLSGEGEVKLTIGVDAERRPDRIFQGLGALTETGDRARFRRDRVEPRVQVSMRPWRRSELRISVGITHNEFSADGYSDGSTDPSLAESLRSNTFAELPPGFGGYSAYRQRLVLRVDSREEPPAPGHGVQVEGMAEQGFDLVSGLQRSWIRYGGTVAGFIDAGNERVFSLHLRAELVDPLGDDEVPFTEQARLGGRVTELAGFLSEQLIGRSSVVASLRYRYPVWVYLDASLFVSAGNVFDERFEDFDLEHLRLSGGFALQTTGDDGHGLAITLALGTAPLADGFVISSFRFMVGGQPRGFL